MRIVPFYDRSELISRAVETLKHALLEETIIVTLVHIVFLLHLRSVLIVTMPLPLAVLAAFLGMRYPGISANIMSLAGIAIAIGVLVDAAIVVTENAFRFLEQRRVDPRDRQAVMATVRDATHLVGRPIFFSMAIIILAFLPVFALTGQEGKLFHPLAFTKTFAVLGATLLAVTLVPVLCTLLLGGRMHGEGANPVLRPLIWVYRPLLRWALRHRVLTLSAAVVVFAGAVALLPGIGREFMPPLNEGDLMFMPVTDPAISLPQAIEITQKQNAAIQQFPEVASVVAKIGRADTSTDPSPVNMTETVVHLKPASAWRPGMTREKLIGELDAAATLPGVANIWTQPIINRINMLTTGIRSEVGVKLFGHDLTLLEERARAVAEVLAADSGGGRCLSGAGDRGALPRYPRGPRGGGALWHHGGGHPGCHRDGRGRNEPHPDHRRAAALSRPRALCPALSRDARGASEHPRAGAERHARCPSARWPPSHSVSGPAMIASENGLLVVNVLLNVRGRDVGSFVEEARKTVAETVTLPQGSYIEWSGQYENEIRARQRLQIVVPVVLAVIYLLLYVTYHSFLEAAHVLLAVPFALSGGIYLLYALGYNISVAVWVGFIALFGTAVQTAVVMVIYLEEAVARKRQELGGRLTPAALLEAVTEGALLRLRPKVMTVSTVVASLLPIMWSHSTGAEVMKPLATPVLGGMVSSLAHVLLVTPVIFYWLRERELRREMEREARGTGLALDERQAFGSADGHPVPHTTERRNHP